MFRLARGFNDAITRLTKRLIKHSLDSEHSLGSGTGSPRQPPQPHIPRQGVCAHHGNPPIPYPEGTTQGSKGTVIVPTPSPSHVTEVKGILSTSCSCRDQTSSNNSSYSTIRRGECQKDAWPGRQGKDITLLSF